MKLWWKAHYRKLKNGERVPVTGHFKERNGRRGNSQETVSDDFVDRINAKVNERIINDFINKPIQKDTIKKALDMFEEDLSLSCPNDECEEEREIYNTLIETHNKLKLNIYGEITLSSEQLSSLWKILEYYHKDRDETYNNLINQNRIDELSIKKIRTEISVIESIQSIIWSTNQHYHEVQVIPDQNDFIPL